MLKIKNHLKKCIYDDVIDTRYVVELKEIQKGEKITLASDIMFATMFCNESRKKYTAKLLSYFLEDFSYEKILDSMKITNKEVDKKQVLEKGMKADCIIDMDNHYIVIEMNNNKNPYTMDRNIHYADKIYAKGVKRGDRLTKDTYHYTIEINLNNFSFQNNDKTYDIFYIQNEEMELLTRKKIYIQIYIPNVMKKCYNKEKLTDLEKYLYTLFERDIKKSKEIGGNDPIMKDYIKEAEEASGDDDLIDYCNLEAEWLEVGEQRGRAKGYEEGKEEGKEEGILQTKKQTTIEMLRNKIAMEVIVKCTGLSIEEVKQIKEKEYDL